MPEGDNEGEALNSPEVFAELSEADADRVTEAVDLAREIVEQGGARITEKLRTRGFTCSFGPGEADHFRMEGSIHLGGDTEHWLDLSDPREGAQD